jgi:phosphomannomutase/phosphoglucomutase
MWKTGHSLVKAKLKETGAPLGGEMSGHIFFKDRWYGFDDGLYGRAPARDPDPRGRSVGAAERAAESRQHAGTAPAPAGRRELRADRQAAHRREFPGADRRSSTSTACASNTRTASAWRASNTTPVVVMRFEARTPEALARIQAEFKRVILAAKPDADLPF